MEIISEEYKSLDLFSANFESRLTDNGKVFVRKIEQVIVRQAIESEVVDTYMSDGTLETSVIAGKGDWVITGPKGEEFILTDEKINDLYVRTESGDFVTKARKIIALKNPTGTKIRIKAPWGTDEKPVYQYGGTDCVVAVGLTEYGALTDNRYIIGEEDILLSNYNPQ